MNPSHQQEAFVCHEHGYPSDEAIRHEGLASDTLVRANAGIKRVGDVQVGDYLYDADKARIHRLTLTTIGTRPFASKNRVYWFTLCDRELTVKDDDPRPSSSLSDAPLMKLDNADEDRFAAVRKSLDSIVCECGGPRKVQRYFKSKKQAQLALRILQSDFHHLIDPLFVRDGREFSMTVQEYERVCSKEVKRGHLKLYRAPLPLTHPRYPQTSKR